ncbi:MAG: hypothetical protein EYC70_12790 [Planctomycetota bacterium]|nr:MAG: hypothetical protein EYC70_12790 [Planctomycetota bacterium]
MLPYVLLVPLVLQAPDREPGSPSASAVALAVVAPAAWEAALQPFLEQRRRELTAVFLPLEDAVATGAGDAPERLKRRLHALWQESGLRYALLVGDADTLPVRFMVLDRNTEAAHNYAFYASDLYYADLAREGGGFEDWNGARDGCSARYYGEVRGEHFKDSPINYDGISYVPEIGVGRWPVSDVESLQTVIAKTLAWPGSGARVETLVAAHGDGWVDARAALAAWIEPFPALGWTVDRQFYGERDGVPSTASVMAGIRQGATLVLHAGHGDAGGWDRCLGADQELELAACQPAVFFSVGCGTAHFCAEAPYQAYLDADGVPHRGTTAGEVFLEPPPAPAPLQPGRFNSTSLGERLLRMPAGGAVAYIGCNTGAQPCALSLMQGFLQHAGQHPDARVGDAWQAALAFYYDAERLATLQPDAGWYPPSIFFQGMKFMLFGDPTLPLAAAPGRE